MNQRGIVLVQVLVWTMIIGIVCTHMIQWAYAHVVISAKQEATIRQKAIAETAMARAVARWQDGMPSDFSETIDGHAVVVSVRQNGADYTVDVKVSLSATPTTAVLP